LSNKRSALAKVHPINIPVTNRRNIEDRRKTTDKLQTLQMVSQDKLIEYNLYTAKIRVARQELRDLLAKREVVHDEIAAMISSGLAVEPGTHSAWLKSVTRLSIA